MEILNSREINLVSGGVWIYYQGTWSSWDQGDWGSLPQGAMLAGDPRLIAEGLIPPGSHSQRTVSNL